mmetsp:Transcript_9199/g.25852  ORF Transcript_9199/g.25852 Transcript_9199/m.25852 type:complete len:208 (-) Transcript_9199:58-681(-)
MSARSVGVCASYTSSMESSLPMPSERQLYTTEKADCVPPCGKMSVMSRTFRSLKISGSPRSRLPSFRSRAPMKSPFRCSGPCTPRRGGRWRSRSRSTTRRHSTGRALEPCTATVTRYSVAMAAACSERRKAGWEQSDGPCSAPPASASGARALCRGGGGVEGEAVGVYFCTTRSVAAPGCRCFTCMFRSRRCVAPPVSRSMAKLTGS